MSSPGNMRTGIGFSTTYENYIPETFLIIYLILSAILRRCGFKDCSRYAKHSKAEFTQDMFDTGVIFNLYSEYGVGKSLEPLIYELLSTGILDAEKNERNIFFREVVRLFPEVIKIIRLKNPIAEAEWILMYSVIMKSVKDDISNERIMRLSDLLYDAASGNVSSDENKCDDDINNYSDDMYDSDNDLYDIALDSDYESNPDSIDNTLYMGMGEDKDTSNMQTNQENTIVFSNLLPGGEKELCYCPFCHEFRKHHNNFDSRDVGQMINNTLIEISRDVDKR
jgi:hypothetical protein